MDNRRETLLSGEAMRGQIRKEYLHRIDSSFLIDWLSEMIKSAGMFSVRVGMRNNHDYVNAITMAIAIGSSSWYLGMIYSSDEQGQAEAIESIRELRIT